MLNRSVLAASMLTVLASACAIFETADVPVDPGTLPPGTAPDAGQDALGRFQHQEFKQLLVVVLWQAPLKIVILQHQRVGGRPVATFHESESQRDGGW